MTQNQNTRNYSPAASVTADEMGGVCFKGERSRRAQGARELTPILIPGIEKERTNSILETEDKELISGREARVAESVDSPERIQ